MNCHENVSIRKREQGHKLCASTPRVDSPACMWSVRLAHTHCRIGKSVAQSSLYVVGLSDTFRIYYNPKARIPAHPGPRASSSHTSFTDEKAYLLTQHVSRHPSGVGTASFLRVLLLIDLMVWVHLYTTGRESHVRLVGLLYKVPCPPAHALTHTQLSRRTRQPHRRRRAVKHQPRQASLPFPGSRPRPGRFARICS